MKKPLTFISRNFIPHVFLEILPRYCKLIILGTLDTWLHTPKVSLSTFVYQLKKLSSLSIDKKSTSLVFFWRCCKDMQISFFCWYFGYAWYPWNPILCHFVPFLPKFGQKWIFLEQRTLLVFKYSNYLPLCGKVRKSYQPIPEENAKLADGKTDNCDFIWPSVGRGSKNKEHFKSLVAM